MNLKVLKRSRRNPKVGDIFVVQMPGTPFFFGRVIRTDASVGGFDNCILVYFYRTFNNTKLPVPKLDRENLLLPPVATNARPWTMGYFENVDHSEVEKNDVRPVHCFRDFTGKLYDDNGRRLNAETEPVGEYGLQSYQTIDDLLSDALGRPRAD